MEFLSREEHRSIARSSKVGGGVNELIHEKVAAGVDNIKEKKYHLRLKRMREKTNAKVKRKMKVK